jgi:hypothetical protein
MSVPWRNIVGLMFIAALVIAAFVGGRSWAHAKRSAWGMYYARLGVGNNLDDVFEYIPAGNTPPPPEVVGDCACVRDDFGSDKTALVGERLLRAKELLVTLRTLPYFQRGRPSYCDIAADREVRFTRNGDASEATQFLLVAIEDRLLVSQAPGIVSETATPIRNDGPLVRCLEIDRGLGIAIDRLFDTKSNLVR